VLFLEEHQRRGIVAKMGKRFPVVLVLARQIDPCSVAIVNEFLPPKLLIKIAWDGLQCLKMDIAQFV
jgi:hypothetical protein